MAKLDDITKGKMFADFHAGMSQINIAKKYGLSAPTVNRYFCGDKPKHVHHVNKLTDIIADLAGVNEFELESISDRVTQRIQDMHFFRSASMLIAKRALTLVAQDSVSMTDLEKAQGIIGKGRDNIYGKHPDTAVQVNTENAQITYGWEE